MGQCYLFHQRSHVGAFCHGGLEEFLPGRGVIKQIPDNDGGAFRSANLLRPLFRTAFYLIPGSGKAVRCLGNQFHLGNCRNACQGLTAEPQGGYGKKILHGLDLTGCMAQECQGNLVLCYAAAIIRHPYHAAAPILYLYGYRGGLGIDGIFKKLLDHGGRAFNHFSCCYLVNCILV